MGKGSAKQEVTEYYMSMHLGLVHGPLDAIKEIVIGEKMAWSGTATVEGPIAVSAPELFGGSKKEGGVGGIAYYLPGGPNQVMPEVLAGRLGLTSQTCPGFRGIASVFFVGQDNFGSVAIPGDTGGGSSGGGGEIGGGGGGGGISGGGGGFCVVWDSWLPGPLQAENVTLDTALTVLDYTTMDSLLVQSCVRGFAHHDNQPCVGIVTRSGVELGVSTATPLTMRDGSTPNVLACLGREVPVYDGNGFRWEEIVELRDIGNRRVVHIDAGGATFAAGRRPDRFVLTHNMAKPYEEIQN